MKDLFKLLLRFVPPYKRYLFLNIFFNLFSTLLSIFSFMLIIPILEILFKTSEASYTFIPWSEGDPERYSHQQLLLVCIGTNQNPRCHLDPHAARCMAHCNDLCQDHDQLPEFGLHHTAARRRGTRHTQLRVPQGGEPAHRIFHHRTQGATSCRV